jgi:hypothetical protein
MTWDPQLWFTLRIRNAQVEQDQHARVDVSFVSSSSADVLLDRPTVAFLNFIRALCNLSLMITAINGPRVWC